jgi:hypothetical protein
MYHLDDPAHALFHGCNASTENGRTMRLQGGYQRVIDSGVRPRNEQPLTSKEERSSLITVKAWGGESVP